ncbi:MAG: efflux RND transporter periplasmic adaptor subunit [Sedimentisphaerales bacterium]|nr:efflux RND transporter periplasmic adaptor subunit [Sedimentisphaerales bacterium]
MNRATSVTRMAVWQTGKVLVLVAVLIALMLWLSGAFIHKIRADTPIAASETPPTVAKNEMAQTREFPLIVEQVGTVQTRTQAQVAGRIMAQVLEVTVHEGQAVTGPGGGPGSEPTVLAQLDARDVEARLRQAQIQVTAAEKALAGATAQLAGVEAQQQAAEAQAARALADFKRMEGLFASQAVSSQDLDHARAQKDVTEAQVRAAVQQVAAVRNDTARLDAQKEQAEAAVREAQVMLSFTTIEAPLSGRVVRKMIDPGDMVTPGQPLFVIETPAEPELHAVVGESLVAGMKPEQKLDVRIDAIRQTLQGTVREIVPQADPRTRTMLVKVSLPPQANLVSGQFGVLSVPTGTYQALVIPAVAVRQVGQLHLVDVVDDKGVSHRRFVTLGRSHDDLVEVLSGLKQTERIVVP